MDKNLSPEHFHLIRKVLRESPQKQQDRPLKRKRPKLRSYDPKDTDPAVTISIDSSSEPESKEEPIQIDSDPDDNLTDNGDTSEDDFAEENYGSDEFEDVTEPADSDDIGDVSVTIDSTNKEIKKNRPRVKNICSNEERHWRRYYHMANLACLMVHGADVNKWINNPRLLKRLSKLIPESLFSMLHPKKDEEMPLRSTRKLLDGLRKCMELWQKHWKIKRRYAGLEYYMRGWQEISGTYSLKKTYTEKDFVRQVLKGHGNCDLATQGFVALLRSCNVNARLIMSCQPPDFTNLKERELASTRDYSYESVFKYPIFWCEVWDKFSKKWITVDPTNLKTIEQVRNGSKLEPRGVSSSKRNILRYVIGFDRKDGCKDVTRRYSTWFNSKCRKRRITNLSSGSEWFGKVIRSLHRRKRTKIDDYEEEYFDQRDENEGMPDNLQDLKNHPKYLLEKDLRNNQVLKPNSKECGYLNVGNGKQILKVYDRKDVIDLKSAKQWYMEGRVLKVGSRTRKKIMKSNRGGRFKNADAEPEEERLYSIEDTQVYSAPPASVPTGKIEVNTYGNIEVFTPSMIPANCCLIESPVAIKAAKFVQVEYARAVTGFKFERGNASKPIIGGVVVARWFKDAVVAAIDGIEYVSEEEEREKHELAALNDWNVLLMKIRIKKNLNETYGSVQEQGELEPEDSESSDEAPGGGFFPSANADNEEAKPTAVESDEAEYAPATEEDPTIDVAGGFDKRTEEARTNSPKSGGFIAPEREESVSASESPEAEQDKDDNYDQFMEEMGFSDEE